MDEWDINAKGVILNHITTKSNDAIYILNDDGKRDDNKKLEFKYGAIAHKHFGKKGSKGYEVFTIRGDANAEDLFEFLGNNISGSQTMVEFSIAQTGIPGTKGLNFITTSHDKGGESGMTELYINQLQFGYTIRRMGHTHPLGEDFSKNDLDFFQTISDNQFKNGRIKLFNLKKEIF